MNKGTAGSSGDLCPARAVIAGFEDSLTVVRIALDALAGADPDVAVAIDCDRADRLCRLLIEYRREGSATVAAAPYSATRRANINQAFSPGIGRDGSHPSL